MKFLQSKFAVPAPSLHLIDRPRLFEILSNEKRASLVILQAPAGYGKTTLALQYLATLPHSARAWLHLDTGDRDARRFLGYLVESLSGPVTSLKSEEIRARIADSRTPVQEIVDDICFYLQEYKGPSCWLVLDNFEVVNDDRDVCALVSRLTEHSGRRVSTIIATRTRPAFKFRKLQENGQVIFVNQQDLAFDYEECAEAVKARLQSNIEDADLMEIWRLTSGWCVNVGLIAESLQRRGLRHSADIAAAVRRSESLADYMHEEFFQDLSPCFLDFLARCSVFDSLSVENCAGIVAPAKHVKTNLDLLMDSAIPHTVLSESGYIRLHPLIRRAANQVLRENLPREELEKLYKAVSDYYENLGMIAESIDLLMELPDYDGALKILDRDWYKIIEQNGQNRIEHWLTAFPLDDRDNPLYIKTMSNLLTKKGDYRQLKEYLKGKLEPTRFADDVETFGSLWANYYNAVIHTSTGPVYDKIKLQYDRLLSQINTFSEIQMAIFENTMSVAANQDLKIKTALEHSEKCLARLEDRYFDNRMILNNNRALYRHFLGQTARAMTELENGIRTCTEAGSFSAVPAALAVMADILLSNGQFRNAVEVVDRNFRIMKERDVYSRGMHAYAERFKGAALWYLGDHDSGLRLMENAYRASADFDRGMLISTGFIIEFFNHLDGREKKYVDEGDIPPRGRISEGRLLYLSKEAYLAAAAGDYRHLKSLADELMQIAEISGMIPWKMTAFFYLAFAADLNRKQDVCEAAIKAGLEIMKQLKWSSYPMVNGLLSSFVFVHAVTSSIMIPTARKLITGEYVFDITPAVKAQLSSKRLKEDAALRLLKVAVQIKPRGLSDTIERLTGHKNAAIAAAAAQYGKLISKESLPQLVVRTLGDFSIISHGRRVIFPRKKSMLLMQILLIHHPDPVHEEVIIEHLWPESDPDKGRSNLRTAVKDLRRALDPYYKPRGQSYIAYDDGHYGLLLPEESNVDFIDFWKISQNAPDNFEQMQNLLTLFKGPFLPQQRYEQFTLEYRERLHQQFLDAAGRHSSHAIETGKFKDARQVLEQGMEFDPLWGEGVQLLLHAWVGEGQFLRALRVYRDYEARLRSELDVEPDEELQRTFRELIKTHVE